MSLFDLPLSIDDHTLLTIDKLRDQMSREEFLCRALELGLCQLTADAANVSMDKTMHMMHGNTAYWRQAQALAFTVDSGDE